AASARRRYGTAARQRIRKPGRGPEAHAGVLGGPVPAAQQRRCLSGSIVNESDGEQRPEAALAASASCLILIAMAFSFWCRRAIHSLSSGRAAASPSPASLGW